MSDQAVIEELRAIREALEQLVALSRRGADDDERVPEVRLRPAPPMRGRRAA